MNFYGFQVIDTYTSHEANLNELANENWVKDALCVMDIDGWYVAEDGSLVLIDDCGQAVWADTERFKVRLIEEWEYDESEVTK